MSWVMFTTTDCAAELMVDMIVATIRPANSAMSQTGNWVSSQPVAFSPSMLGFMARMPMPRKQDQPRAISVTMQVMARLLLICFFSLIAQIRWKYI